MRPFPLISKAFASFFRFKPKDASGYVVFTSSFNCSVSTIPLCLMSAFLKNLYGVSLSLASCSERNFKIAWFSAMNFYLFSRSFFFFKADCWGNVAFIWLCDSFTSSIILNSSFVIYYSGSMLNAWGIAFKKSWVKFLFNFYKVYKSILSFTCYSFFESAIAKILSGPIPFEKTFTKYSLIFSDYVLGDISV